MNARSLAVFFLHVCAHFVAKRKANQKKKLQHNVIGRTAHSERASKISHCYRGVVCSICPVHLLYHHSPVRQRFMVDSLDFVFLHHCNHPGRWWPAVALVYVAKQCRRQRPEAGRAGDAENFVVADLQKEINTYLQKRPFGQLFLSRIEKQKQEKKNEAKKITSKRKRWTRCATKQAARYTNISFFLCKL